MYIVIAAYKAEKFIEACLDAACPQGMVLLGIDGCKETLDKVKKIRHKYKDLRVFWFPENKGCYLTKNALIEYVPDTGVFITFDADDIMNKGMAKTMAKHVPCISRHVGVMCITKEMWNEFGGYRPWQVSADTDLMWRIKTKYKVSKIARLFYRRKHEGQLTRSKDVGLKSEFRKKIRLLIDENLESDTPQLYFKPEKNIGYELS